MAQGVQTMPKYHAKCDATESCGYGAVEGCVLEDLLLVVVL